MSSYNLVEWDKIRTQIEEAKDIQTLSSMSDSLEAMRVWAKQSKQSLEVQNKIAEYRLRIERKKGEWLKDNIRVGNPSGSNQYTELSTVTTIPTLADIGISRDESSKAQMIAKLDNEQFENYIEETKATNKEVTLSEAVRLAKQIIREEKIDEQIEEIEKENLELPDGLFDVIVIDPPWNYGTKYSPESPMSRVANPYPEMTQEQLLKIILPAKDDCVLWLWTTNGFMKDAYELLEEWGFAPKTILTWNKVNFGIGYWLRNVTEHCILAVKGSPVWTNKTYSTLLTEKRTEHSVKPESFYKMVDDICVGRKLDYFARKKREEWDVFGTLELEE
jgi:N6-adenosine-specific RNA methylase IME4